MTAEEMWDAFFRREHPKGTYEAWSYGDDPDLLAQLTLEGVKTATASAYYWYEQEGESLPKAGEYSVILDSRNEAVCIIQTTRVYIAPFDQVDAVQAFREGEGDRTLEYWRQTHMRFFAQELNAAGVIFDEKMPVVCEEFRKVYP